MEIVRKHSKSYNFIGNRKSGVTIRWGKNANENPYRAPIPELVDISISNHCSKGCGYCYRDSKIDKSFIKLEDYEFILKSLNSDKWGNVFQVALGGGEPLEHPYFIDILNISKDYNVVPNFTTNGEKITKKIANEINGIVGAAAISFEDVNLIKDSKANLFIKENVKTNIHFILNKESIKQGIKILKGEYNHIFEGFNSIIFLTYKPMGRGEKDLCLELKPDLLEFSSLIDRNKCAIKIGFDACFVPLLMYYTNTLIDLIEPCECAFFSAYIDENLNAKPCSFSNDSSYTYNLKEFKFYDIWNVKWEPFRKNQVNNCKSNCKMVSVCRGGCPYFPMINFCKK